MASSWPFDRDFGRVNIVVRISRKSRSVPRDGLGEQEPKSRRKKNEARRVKIGPRIRDEDRTRDGRTSVGTQSLYEKVNRMASIMWALLSLTAICGTTWGYPIGVATLTTREEVHLSVSSASSSSEEDEVIVAELKPTATTDRDDVAVEGVNPSASSEEATPDVVDEVGASKDKEGKGKPGGGDSTVASVSATLIISDLTDSKEDVDETEDSSNDVSES